MGSDWPVVALGDYCLKIGSGATPKGGSSVYLSSGEITLIRSQNIYNDGFKHDGLVFITSDAATKLKNVIVENNDILINITGDSVARVCQVDNNVIPARVNQHVAIVRPKPNELDSRYLRYFLVDQSSQNLLLTLASAGATRNALTKNMLETFVVTKPPLPDQKRIAHILGSLDDKIELNRQMNQTLEAMAQALFKSWFVDFDPVIDNALKAGNPIPEPLQKSATIRQDLHNSGQATPLPEHIQKLFPNSFTLTDEMGWVPEGWEVKELKEVTTELRRGISPKYIEEGGIRVINQRCIRDHSIMYANTRRNDPSKRKVEGRLLETGDLLINSTGVGTLGRMAQVLSLDEPTVIDSHVTVARPDQNQYAPFTFGRMMLSIESHVEAMGHGSTGQTELSRADLSVMPVIRPPISLQKQAEVKFSEWAMKCEINNNQMGLLSKLRDTLLPKLISGELRILEAEEQIKEAVA